jgi:hypothetical protein
MALNDDLSQICIAFNQQFPLRWPCRFA